MAVKRTKKDEIAVRRAKVIDLRVQGMKYRDIAEHLGVSLATIGSDMTTMLQELGEQRRQQLEHYVAIQVERQEMLIAAHLHNALDLDSETFEKSATIVDRAEAKIAKFMGTEQPTRIENKDVTEGGTNILQIEMIGAPDALASHIPDDIKAALEAQEPVEDE